MRLKHYVLDDDHRPVEATLSEWAHFFENISNRVVGHTQITSRPLIEVSTVFFGLDHRFAGNGPPILFETMVFGGPLDRHGQRYASWDDAVAGHSGWVRRARAAMKAKQFNIESGRA